jgi:hypothetical protein
VISSADLREKYFRQNRAVLQLHRKKPNGCVISVTGEPNGLYSSPSIVRVIKARRMRWAGHVALMGEVRGAYNILVGRPEGRRPLRRPGRRW